MTYVKVLADLFGLMADWEGDGVRLGIPPPFDENNCEPDVALSVVELHKKGSRRPVDHELKEVKNEESALL